MLGAAEAVGSFFIGWITQDKSCDSPWSLVPAERCDGGSYFTYFTCTFSILPLNLNGAWS